MADPWEDQYDTITEDEESGPWQDFAPVIRDAVPGSLTPPDPIAPTFEAPISITEEGPLYKREQEEAAKAAALYAPPTPVQPPSLAPVREAEVPKLFKPEHIPGTGIPLTAAEKALGPSEQTKKEQAQLEVYRQAVDLASQQAQRDLTNAELAKIGEDAARAVDFFGAIQRIPTEQGLLGAIGKPLIAAGEGAAAVAYGQGLNRLAEDVAAGDLNFPRFRSAVGRTQAGVGFSPLEKGGVELASIAPDIAITGAGQAVGIPSPVTFGTLSAARAAAQGATPEQVALAGATGAAAPGAGQLGTKVAATILKGAVNRGLLSASRETALKALESLGGQAGFQTFFAGMSLPEIAALPPEKRWDFIAEQGVKNLVFSALDIPKFKRGVTSETRKELVSDFLDMMAKQGPMGAVLKVPAERGVPVSLGTEAEAKVPVSANPETISSNLGLEFLGTTRTTDRYVYNGINPRTGRPAGITVSVPQGTGERGVSEKMQSRLAEYEMAPKKEAASPEGITIPEKLKLREGEEIRLTISEQQDYQDYIRRGFTPEQSLEMALTISGRTTTPVKPQMIKGTVPEPSLKSFRTGEFKGVPMAENAMWDFLTKRYGIGKGNLVQIVEKPDSMESGELLYNPTTRQPIRIVLNRSQIATNGQLFDVLQHEAAHWYDLANPGRAKYLVGTLKGEEIKAIEDAVKKLPYSWNELPAERTAKVIQKLANEWSKRTWFQNLADEIRIFANRTIGIKLTRRAAQTVAVRAIAGSLKAAREPAPKTPTSRWTEQTLPKLVEGDRLVSVERPDGTRYVASYNPEKVYDLTPIGKGKIPQIGKPLGDSWSHGPLTQGDKIIEDAGKSGMQQTERAEALMSKEKPEEPTPPAVSEKATAAESEFRRIEEQQERIEAQRGKPTQALPSEWETMVGKITKGQRDKLLETIQSQPYGLKIQHELLKIADTIDRDNFDLRLKQAIRSAGRSLQPIEVETQIVPEAGVSEKAMGAAAPGEFPQPEVARTFRAFDGWAGRAKEALQKVKEYFTPPQVGELPEVEIQSGAVLPRLPDYAKEKVIASAPHGMAKVPGLGAIMDTRATAHTPADAAFLARANSVSKGKTFAAMWAQTQWRYKDLFRVEQDTGTFRLANGERGYLSDVIEAELRDPGSQPLTHAQWQWIHNEWKPILDEIRRQLHNEGVSRISTEDMEFDLATDYFPRPAIGKRNRPATGAGGRPAGRPGAKQFFQKSRKFASEQEGARPGTPEAPKEEIIYDPDTISRVTKFISGSYRAIADHRLANDPALGAGTVPDYWGVGRQTMAGPAFAGKIYPVEIAQKIERQFAQDVRGWVRNTANLTSAAKALMATADVSAPFIQGAAMFGRNPVRWAKATINSYRALTDPNFVAKLMEHPRYKELAEGYSQSGGSLLQLQDFLAGLREGQIATRIPGYGRFLTATGRSYGAFLDLAKLELFDAWKRVTPPSELPRLVETIENSLFMGRMEQAGMNPHRAIGERLLFFAPSYYRGAAGLVSTAFQKGVSGKMARQMLGGYAAASMLVTMSAYLAMGMDWDEIKQRLQPGRGKFLKVPVNLGDGERVEVGFGNILTQIVRLAFQAANYHTINKPIDTGVEANPYLRFLRGRAAFIPGVAIELATGRDYFGRRISAKESLVRHFSPFVFQSMFPRDEASIRQRAGDAAFTFFGLNAYAESEYEKARNQMDLTARKVSGKPFSQLTVPERAKVVYQFKLTPEYKKREPSPTDMERIININAERQANLQKSLGESAEKLARMGLRVPGYRSTFQYKGVAVPMTERERERYQEILSGLYKTQIGKLNESTVLKSPVPQREKWWSEQAEKIGIEARRRLAGEISANKIK